MSETCRDSAPRPASARPPNHRRYGRSRTQRAAFQIAELVEQEQRMITGAGIMAVPDAHLLFAARRADARIHVEHDAFWRTGPWTASIHRPERSARAEKFFSA